jgi:DNA-binding CsgD family transcriptional regulator
MDPTFSLSEKEKQVVDLLMQGKSNKQIALQLGITNRTVEFHLTNIYQKLGVNSRSEAILALSHPLRESTVADPSQNRHDDPITQPVKGLNMNKKPIWIIGGLVFGLVAIIFILLTYLQPVSGRQMQAALTDLATPPTTAVPTATALPTPSPIPAATTEPIHTTSSEYSFAQTVNGVDVRLTVNWFYVDDQRIDLNYTLCDPAIPVDDSPMFMAHSGDIKITTPGGLAMPIQVDYTGGGSTLQIDPLDSNHACLKETLDFTYAQPMKNARQDGLYVVDLPVGGEVRTDSDRVINISEITFHLSIKPTFSDSLTLSADQSAPFGDKTVKFKGVLADPTGMRSILCVDASDGRQWMPTSNLVYKGNVIVSRGASVTSGDPSGEMCYSVSYPGEFKIDSSDQVRRDVSVMVTKLFMDMPEVISPEAIAQANQKLAAEGIIFEYVTVSHGARFEIKQMPAGMSETEADIKVQQALSQEAVPPQVVVFILP